MKRYVSVFRMTFIAGMQYRSAALAGLATQFAWGFMELLAFSAFYRMDPASFPMEFSQTVSYIWLQQAFLALFMTWFYDKEIFASITNGGIAYELVRPIDLYARWFALSAAGRVAKAALRCAPILIVAFAIPGPMRMSLPPSTAQGLMFVLSMALGLGVVTAFVMLVYIATFYTLSPLGVRLVAAMAADFFAGAIIPLPFFPEGFRKIAEMLPFAAMQNMPLRIYSGNIAGMDAMRGIALQIFWLLALVLFGKWGMKKALGRVIVQGG